MGLEKLFDFLISIIELFYFTRVVKEYQSGVVLRLGKYHRTVGPGLKWLIPFNVDELLVTNAVVDTTCFMEKVLTLKDGNSIMYGMVITYTIDDAKKALLEVEDHDTVLSDCLVMEAPDIIREYTWADLQEPQAIKTINKEILRVGRLHARRYGIALQKTAIVNIAKTRVLTILPRPG